MPSNPSAVVIRKMLLTSFQAFSWAEYRAVVLSVPTAWISTATILASSENRKNGSYCFALSPENAVKSSTAFIEALPEKGEESAWATSRQSKAAIVRV